MLQERLNSLSLISTESDELKEIHFEEVYKSHEIYKTIKVLLV